MRVTESTGPMRGHDLGSTGSAALVQNPAPARVNASDTGELRFRQAMQHIDTTDYGLEGTTSSIDARGTSRVSGRTNTGFVSNTTTGMRTSRHVSKTGRRGPSHAARKEQRFPVVAVIVVLVLVIATGVGGFMLISNLMHPYEGADVPDGQTVSIVIPEGSTGTDIVNQLLEAGVIHSTADFRKAVKNQNADQLLRCGSYTFETGSDPKDVVKQLVQGPNSDEQQLQIPEGLTVTQTASYVEEQLGIPSQAFLDQAKASNYANDYDFLSQASNDSLEGFLYPKTYDFGGREITADSVIRQMLSQFELEMESLDLEGARSALYDRYKLQVSNYDIVKIASIIEKEAITDEDRPKVSSVFYNRLSQSMALQSDATMSYVTDGVVTSEDLMVDSPYNTYYYKGLPPTPICTPSGWAIEAAMYPADTDDLFFFIIEADGYSNHTFSKTYEEHESAYQAALEEQRAAASAADESGE